MGKIIKIRINDIFLKAELNNNPAAEELQNILPLEMEMTRWGDEYYGECGLNQGLLDSARSDMEIGELAVWPTGKALCIFFGPTPVSTNEQPRAASNVNPVGKILDDITPLKNLEYLIKIKIVAE